MSHITITQLGKVATVALNRPEVHNAFDDKLIRELTVALLDLEREPNVHAIVLSGVGPSFSAGADMTWMRRMASAPEEDNRADALKLAELMRTLAFLAKPTIARVHGNAFGGGVGLVACCDIAIASSEAKFGLTEVRLGLVPAVISQYVVDAIGARHALRYFQTAEVFDAQRAREIGLVHEVASPDELEAFVGAQLAALAKAGPEAVREAKALALRIAGRSVDRRRLIDEENAALIAKLRVSPEGQEGLAAFLEKRKPAWLEA
ncbi:MAG TPA: enoyl-CoA hydratase/isomerase family protein [Candidatus Saccharimonadia bacterium]|nr:enoyl-CoA hydratase/isomerase family protein [Candidatus Saccharimonadia bacterium]